MANVPISAQTNLLVTDGLVFWGNRALSPIPDDPAEPEELCCDAVVQQQDPQAQAIQCAVEQFKQSMVVLGGTRDFICKNPLPRVDQLGWNQYAKSVDSGKPIRYEQPYFMQGLWDESGSSITIEERGKVDDEVLLIYFEENSFLCRETIIKHLGYDYVITDFRVEPFGGENWIRVVAEQNSDKTRMQSFSLQPDRGELEGRIFYTDGIGLGDNDNTYILDSDNAKVQVYDQTGTNFLFDFGEDLSGFPTGSKYTDPDYGKWFKPIEINATEPDTLIVFDQSWQEWIYFNLDGVVLKSEPYWRRR